MSEETSAIEMFLNEQKSVKVRDIRVCDENVMALTVGEDFQSCDRQRYQLEDIIYVDLRDVIGARFESLKRRLSDDRTIFDGKVTLKFDTSSDRDNVFKFDSDFLYGNFKAFLNREELMKYETYLSNLDKNN